MSNRLGLQTLLVNTLGSEAVYFQPPESIKLTYPCIIYQRSKIETDHANNSPYSLKDKYTIFVIDPDPDSTIPKDISLLSTAFHDRFYTKDGLNHNVFTLYF